MKLEIEVSDEHLTVVLCSGIEGGISYWCREVEFTDLPTPADAASLTRKLAPYSQPLIGGSITFRERQDEPDDESEDEDGAPPTPGPYYKLDAAVATVLIKWHGDAAERVLRLAADVARDRINPKGETNAERR